MIDNRYIDYLRGNQKSEGTIKQYKTVINGFLSYVNKPVNEITELDVECYKGFISNKSSATIHNRICAIKSYMSWANRFGLTEEMIETENVTIKNKIKTVPTTKEIKIMIDCCTNRRNKALLTLLATTALRISEALDITYEQYINMENNSLIITGKGDKQRIISLNKSTIEALKEYVEKERNKSSVKVDSEYLFVNKNGDRMDTGCVDKMIKYVAKKGNIKNASSLTAHYFRHYALSSYADAGVPLHIVQAIAGHSSLKTTGRYLHAQEKDVAQVMTGNNF